MAAKGSRRLKQLAQEEALMAAWMVGKPAEHLIA
jgi:hypothetical protein